MNLDEIILYCSAKAGAEECFPFNEETLVFKVNGKMFLLMGLEHDPLQFSVKCDPELAIELKEQYDCIIPAYHMSKIHWITVVVDNTLTRSQLKERIDHSYDLVSGTKKKARKK